MKIPIIIAAAPSGDPEVKTSGTWQKVFRAKNNGPLVIVADVKTVGGGMTVTLWRWSPDFADWIASAATPVVIAGAGLTETRWDTRGVSGFYAMTGSANTGFWVANQGGV